MSSPAIGSSPIHEESNNTNSTAPDSYSQTQRHGVAPSSPLFLAPSSDGPSSQAHPSSNILSQLNSQSQSTQQRARRQQNRFTSSPIAYPSSDLPDLSSQTNINDANVRRRRHTRGDVHSSDIPSSPMGRRFFTESNSLPSELRSDLPSSAGTVDPNEPVRVIWGTNVSIQECSDNFKTFLMSFKMKYRKKLDDTVADSIDDEKLYYVDALNSMKDSGSTNLNLDTKNLLAYPLTKKLYYQLINYPQEVIPIMDQSIKDCMISLVLDDAPNNDPNKDANVDEIESNIYKVRPFNIQNNKGMRELNPIDIDKLVTVKGLVIRSTAIIPDMKMAFFKCNVCEHTLVVENDRGVIQEPTKCPRPVCASTNSMQLIHNRSSFADKQVIKLQETPDIVPDGQTPHSISLCVYDELVDSTRAGDRVEVCGIFKSAPVKVNPRQRAVKSLYKTYLDIVHIKKIDKHRLGADVSTLENELKEQQEVEDIKKLTEEEVEKIKEVSKRDDLYEVLARSLAPSIYEMDDVKKGILLQLFGGTNKTFVKGGKYRGDINILLCGDPSTSKSQILQYVHKISPRGIYTSGKGSSAVGLTAYITRDVETKQLVLESGALVLSDGGICCIDEFDKMSDSTRSVLHEVMEQQTISIAKAGIITTLNARTSILASANPIESRYNPNLPVTKNIDLPPPLLSRFDLVYLILDKVDEKIDTQLAKHIAGMFLDNGMQSATKSEVLPVEFLSQYIQYAKENISPKLTEEAKNELVKAYVDMRKLGEDVRSSDKRITATTRQLESMIRLAEAHAKMKLSEIVTLDDVKEAVRLIKSAIKDYATDPLTGRIDMDLVQTGQTSAERRLKEDLTKQLLELVKAHEEIAYDNLMAKINEQSSNKVENLDMGEALRRLEAENQITVIGSGHKRSIRINKGLV
ncbi:hypothetical protein CANARDRAFT_204553 [[Candida] arabinofermentans NRRL YB-2248]|uniref:DNA replication licensing factor MCM4 n=1 Tax=[Candida] arabinofermentans NRRL YB-2248 TaxID=983967 RepID=A0A1E4STG6_9ASCO|nr:hypothetical protein CANARDRAFT_204553 [[Candida] arabinofermentans NRRL YB-2248]